MTKEQAIEILQILQSYTELNCPEKAHILADGVLCELLTALGHADVVQEFNKLEKWYA